MSTDNLPMITSLDKRAEVSFLYRVLESGDLGVSSGDFDRLLAEHEAYHDACNCCAERMIGEHAAQLRDNIGLDRSALSEDEIIEGRTPRSSLSGKYIAALG